VNVNDVNKCNFDNNCTHYLLEYIHQIKEIQLDFSKINSLTDLLNENDKTKNQGDVVMELCKPVFQEDPEVGMDVVITILSELLGLHNSVMNEAIENGEGVVACNWAMDTVRIDDIITTLKNIQM